MENNTDNLNKIHVRCINIPTEGNFDKGEIYSFYYGIDYIGIKDKDGVKYTFGDIYFCWYFAKL